jgi:hypothetical protein
MTASLGREMYAKSVILPMKAQDGALTMRR